MLVTCGESAGHSQIRFEPERAYTRTPTVRMRDASAGTASRSHAVDAYRRYLLA